MDDGFQGAAAREVSARPAALPRAASAARASLRVTVAPQLAVLVDAEPSELPPSELLQRLAAFVLELPAPLSELTRALGAALAVGAHGGHGGPPLRALALTVVDSRGGLERRASAVLGGRQAPVEQKPWGRVLVLHETDGRDGFGLYRLEVAPGATLPLHHHQRMDERELVATAGLELLSEPRAGQRAARQLEAGERFHWPLGALHGYRNSGTRTGAVWCLDRPRFIPEDEIEA